MSNLLRRPALGQVASIGALYDARSDEFPNRSLFNSNIPKGVVISQELNEITWRTCYSNSYVERSKAMNIGLDLAASLISGLSTPEGSGRQLLEKDEYVNKIEAWIIHTFAAVRENLDVTNSDIRSCISNAMALRSSEATHIVTQIEYGAESVVVFEKSLMSRSPEENESPWMMQNLDHLVDGLKAADNNALTTIAIEFDQLSVRSTTLGTDGIVLNHAAEAMAFLDLMPLKIQSQASGKGVPVCFHLMPIDMLDHLRLVKIIYDIPPMTPASDLLDHFILTCDKILQAEHTLRNYVHFVVKHKFCFHSDYVRNIQQDLCEVVCAYQDFKREFGRKLQSVRRGSANLESLRYILDTSLSIFESLEALLLSVGSSLKKILAINTLTKNGAVYLGHNSTCVRSQLVKQGDANSYLLFLNELALQNQDCWDKNHALMLKLLDGRNGDDTFVIVDCDAAQIPLEHIVIKQYRNGVEIVKDLQEEQQYLASHCIAKRLPGSLEADGIPKPTKRCFMKMPCPGSDCDNVDCEWQCPTCRTQLEHSHTDNYVYCDCGRSPYDTFQFKCKSVKHGEDFIQFETAKLLSLLKGLDQSNYLNILILGETGVGKSTFINAFVNYLNFETLDQALLDNDLHWVIPCNFSLQTMDRSEADSEINETRIEVGSRADEHDGSKGKSATQTTQVYPINLEGVTYRLIDTPGIGDTRGLDYDKRNMEDILKTVSGYDHLHGILILLKPNNARLTAQFSFCIKELLTHLHRDAVNNVVFGFTNTRVSHYTPGDTLGPLKTLLEEHKDIGLKCSSRTTYCFDSESFRFLAAAKKNIKLENKPDFDSSWTKSRSETMLMLEHFKSKKPHPIRSTISLNATRNLILELVKPMTDITQTIRNNIAIQQEEAKVLEDHKLTGVNLNAKLHPEKQFLRKKTTSRPRTVCTDPMCTEFRDDGTGNNLLLTDYPNPCHSPCSLNNVLADVRAHPNLIQCIAFGNRNVCSECGHHWSVHMHILYELESFREKVLDHTIQKLIQENASDAVKKVAAVQRRKDLVAEYEKERDEVQQAAAKFGFWMKENSIMPYNDATKAYIEVLIKGEQAKVDAGGIQNKKVLADLERDLGKHQELVRVLDESMRGQGKARRLTQDEVMDEIQQLYKLKHFGENLKCLRILNTAEHERTNREIPHRVKFRRFPQHHASTPAMVTGQQVSYSSHPGNKSNHSHSNFVSTTTQSDLTRASSFSRGLWNHHLTNPSAAWIDSYEKPTSSKRGLLSVFASKVFGSK